MISKQIFVLFALILFLSSGLSTCSPTTETLPDATQTKPQSTPTITTEPTAPPTTEAQETSKVAVKPSEPADFPLSEPGPYFGGNRVYTLIDDSRNGREIELLIWYPAQKQVNDDGRPIVRDAEPDLSGAPYPLILTEADSGRHIFLSHLATHGFVLAVVKSPLSGQAEQLEEFLWIEPVRDFLLALDQIASNPPEALNGLIDSDHAGVTGYSYGGDISLAISGARLDPAFYLSQCEQMNEIVPESLQWVYTKWNCLDFRKWDEFIANAGEEITISDDGLWQQITDQRIRAVMPMAPTLSWYYGERGLAAVDRPILLIWGTKDILSPYELEAGYTFEHLVTPERYLISFIGKAHMFPMAEYGALRLKHFVTAFFGYYLQGREDYAEYFSEDFVNQFDDLAWGVYEGE